VKWLLLILIVGANGPVYVGHYPFLPTLQICKNRARLMRELDTDKGVYSCVQVNPSTEVTLQSRDLE
jgi:hypothetical protein